MKSRLLEWSLRRRIDLAFSERKCERTDWEEEFRGFVSLRAEEPDIYKGVLKSLRERMKREDSPEHKL